MPVRYFALAFGLLYALVGVAGFIPGVTQPPRDPAPPLAIDGSYGYLFNLFPTNVAHNLVHLGVGLLGILAFFRFDTAVWYARGLAVVFGLLAIVGLIPGADTLGGFMPLFGADVALHVHLQADLALVRNGRYEILLSTTNYSTGVTVR